jgi:hypothetical protein
MASGIKSSIPLNNSVTASPQKASIQSVCTARSQRKCRRAFIFHRIFKIFRDYLPLHTLSATPLEWTSFTQLIQDLVGGAVRRNRFTQRELDLLLDLQTSKLRKSARIDALRRYLRAVQAAQAQGADEPPRLSNFLMEIAPRKAAASGGAAN